MNETSKKTQTNQSSYNLNRELKETVNKARYDTFTYIFSYNLEKLIT